MIDLLELTTTGGESAVTELAQKARAYRTAAVCVPQRLAARAAAELEGCGVRVATVIEEPDPGWAARAAEAATDEGADEIDLVVPGDADVLRALVAACRPEVATLKVVVPDAALAVVALDAGADLVVGAPPDAPALLAAVRDHGRGGVKITGLTDAVPALAIVELAGTTLGVDAPHADLLRLGAPGILA